METITSSMRMPSGTSTSTVIDPRMYPSPVSESISNSSIQSPSEYDSWKYGLNMLPSSVMTSVPLDWTPFSGWKSW